MHEKLCRWAVKCFWAPDDNMGKLVIDAGRIRWQEDIRIHEVTQPGL